MLRIDQIEDLHVIPVFAKELRGIGVELTLAVRDDHGLAALDVLKQGVADDRAGLHGTGCAEDGDVPVQSGVLRHTDGLALILAEDRALGPVDRGDLQDLFHLILGHPACRAVDPGLSGRKASGILLLPAEAIMKADVQNERAADGQHPQQALEPVAGQQHRIADEGIQTYLLYGRFARKTSGLSPEIVVLHQLPEEPGKIAERRQRQYRNGDKEQALFLICQANTSL